MVGNKSLGLVWKDRELVSGAQRGAQTAGSKQLVVGGHLVVTGERDRGWGRALKGSIEKAAGDTGEGVKLRRECLLGGFNPSEGLAMRVCVLKWGWFQRFGFIYVL